MSAARFITAISAGLLINRSLSTSLAAFLTSFSVRRFKIPSISSCGREFVAEGKEKYSRRDLGADETELPDNRVRREEREEAETLGKSM